MKKIISFSLTVCLIFSLLSGAVPAAAAGDTGDTVEQTIRALGIMTGDESGNMNLSNNVTRAEFVKMMVAASNYKDSIGDDPGISLFRDLKQTHWAVEYVKTAVDNGWIVGYVDGTFRPGNSITLEEAASAVLRLLGYTSADLAGTFPSAQLSKFRALGLSDGVLKTKGQILSRSDCMTIFYNLMTATAKSGAVYAVTLGYTVNSAGEIDFSALVSAGMKGPFVLDNAGGLSSLLPFDTGNITVYRNGKISALASASAYDVYYYSENMRTVWIYNDRVIGVYTAAAPGGDAPVSVTVAGNEYTIGTSAAAYKLSYMGSYSVGDAVMLLLGKDKTVVDVIAAGEAGGIFYGVVISNQVTGYTDADGRVISENSARIACTDGIVRLYGTGTGTVPVGKLVSVSYSGSQINVRQLSDKSTSGTVNTAGTKLGSLTLAENVQILDTNSAGGYAAIYPARLAGATLDGSDVRYYVLDENGFIGQIILNDVTGDLYTYGLLTGVNEVSLGMNLSGSYKYIISGEPGMLNTSNIIFGVATGAAVFVYKDGAIDRIKNLNGVSLDSLSGLYAVGGDQKYPLSDTVQVYEKIGDSYYLVNVSTVADTNVYKLTGYRDNFGYAAGGKIRVIVAAAKS